MVTRDEAWPAGTPCWADIMIPDVDAARRFYGDVLGWTYTEAAPEFGGYFCAQAGGRNAAGMSPHMDEGQPTAWTLYFASDDADATAKLIEENGGTLVFPPMDVPGTGRMAIAADPAGAAFGVWQPMGMMGSAVVEEPGAFTWDDARLTDVGAARPFYAAVFGHTFDEVPGLPIEEYATFSVDGRFAGGIGGMMGEPGTSYWLVYFAVADADAAVDAVSAGGGEVVRAPEDTPYGRMAQVADPFGAPFALIQLPG